MRIQYFLYKYLTRVKYISQLDSLITTEIL